MAVKRVELLDGFACFGVEQLAACEDAVYIKKHGAYALGGLYELGRKGLDGGVRQVFHITLARIRSWVLSAPVSWPWASTTSRLVMR